MKSLVVSRTFLLVLFFASVQLVEAARAPLLRYRLPKDTTNVYNLQIELRSETGTDILAGNLFVTARPGPSNVTTLGFRGTLSPRRDTTPRPPFGSTTMGYNYPRWSSPVTLNDAELQFDERGRLLRVAGDYSLPCPLGSVAQTLVEFFPAKAESRWEVAEELAMMDEPSVAGPGALLFAMPSGYSSYSYNYPGNPFGSRANVNAAVAVKRTLRYDVKSSTPDQITVTKRIGLDSYLMAGSEPHISAAGEGEVVFEAKSGQTISAAMDCKGVINNESVTRRTTTMMRLKLLTGDERIAAFRPVTIPTSTPFVSQAPKKLTREEIEKILEDLKSSDASVKSTAASKLQSSELSEATPELLEFMATNVGESDSYLRYAAAKVIGDHGTKEHVPLLLKWLKSEDSSYRYAAIRGLTRLKEKSAAEPMATMLATGSDYYQVADALAKIGPDAEDAVLPLLQEKHSETRRQACGILKQIGTKKSLEPLRELMLSRERTVNEAAAEAVRVIMARQ